MGTDTTEAAVKLEAHEHEISSLKHRVKDLETESRAIQELAISVNRMAVNMENMIEELKKHSGRLELLEQVPMESGRQAKAAVITALVGGLVGAVVTAVMALL